MRFLFFRSQEDSPRRQLLHTLPLFADLSARELGVVDSLMHDRSYSADEIVFDEGEEGQAFYVILSGQVAIVREQEPANPLVILKPGQFFGELALLDDSPRMAQARAQEDCVLAVLSRADFTGLLDTHALIASKIAVGLARDLGGRLRQAMAVRVMADTL